jgi:protein-disulfide isomerase
MMKSPIMALLLALLPFSIGPLSATAQDGTADEKTPKKKAPERRLITIVGSTKLDVRQWPLLGKPTAKYIFAEMYDYTCPHCRSLHKSMGAAFKKYGDDIAILALPVPLNASCNKEIETTESQHRDACELARLAIAVWRVKPDKFLEYHNWLFKETRSVADARRQAIKAITEEALDKVLDRKTPDKYLTRHAQLYKVAGRGAVPKCLFPGVTLTGDIGSKKLIRTIKEQLGDR